MASDGKKPLTIRVTDEEAAMLEAGKKAMGMTMLAEFIRSAALRAAMEAVK